MLLDFRNIAIEFRLLAINCCCIERCNANFGDLGSFNGPLSSTIPSSMSPITFPACWIIIGDDNDDDIDAVVFPTGGVHVLHVCANVVSADNSSVFCCATSVLFNNKLTNLILRYQLSISTVGAD